MEKYGCKVSVVIPVYNAEKYLDKCMQSVLAQSLKDLEVILVDDGSQDGSGALCDDYARRDSRVKVLHLENGGPARARNHGIRIACGEYIGFVDSDDYADPSMFEKLYTHAVECKSDIVMCEYYLAQGEKLTPVKIDFQSQYVGAECIRNSLLRSYYLEPYPGLYSMWNKLFRRSMIQDNGIEIDERLRRAEDAWFVFDCLKAAERFHFLPQPLYYYWQNEGSIMHRVLENQYESWVYTRRRLLRENEELKLEFDISVFYQIFLQKVVIYCRELISMGNERKVREIFADEMFQQALPYRKGLPIHMRMLLTFVAWKMEGLAIAGYRLWCLR